MLGVKFEKANRFSLVLIAAVVLFSLAGLLTARSDALYINTTRDCDSNAVLRCGAATPGQVQYKYNAQQGVKAIFNYFNIHTADIRDIGMTAQSGYVTKSGNVLLDGKTVATDAVTAGRQDMPGSKTVDFQGSRFYVRPPSVSFVSSPLSAFVVMNGDNFSYAILASCGNPVNAKPVQAPPKVGIAPAHVVKQPPKQQPPKPQPPQPQPPAPTPATTTINNNNSNVNNNTNINNNENNVNVQVSNQQQQQQQQQSAPSTPPPAPQKQAQPTQAQTQTQPAPAAPAQVQAQPAVVSSAPTGEVLPNTGPGDVFAVAGAVTVLGALGHMFFRRYGLSWLIVRQ